MPVLPDVGGGEDELTVTLTGGAETVPSLVFTLTANVPAAVAGMDTEYVPVELDVAVVLNVPIVMVRPTFAIGLDVVSYAVPNTPMLCPTMTRFEDRVAVTEPSV